MKTNKYPHTDIPTRKNEYNQENENGSSNEIYQNIQSYEETLRGKNNIGDARGVNNICDMFEETYFLKEID